MVLQQIDELKKKLEEQVMKEDSYDAIYESAQIDKLLVEYYKEYGDFKKDLNC